MERGDEVLQMADHNIHGRASIERMLLREKLIENAAERIEVGAGIQREALELFRRHEVDAAKDARALVLRLRHRGLGKFGQSEVEYLELDLAGGQPVHHDIPRLQVAVNKAHGARGHHAFHRLEDDLLEVVHREAPAFDNLI